MESILFLGLTLGAWITIGVICTMFLLLMCTKLAPDVVFLGGMAALYLSGVLSASEALAGFSSTSVVTIGVLFVVIAGLVHTGVVHYIVQYLLGSPKNYNRAIVRLMLPVAGLSAFLTNTTVVALFTSVVKEWSRKLNIAPSKLLIPLSYASGMGGVCTLIGSPSTLIISNLYMNDTHTTLNIFTPTLAGLFCLGVGILSVLAMKRLLPERLSPEEAFESTSDYTVELLVPADCPLIGKTLQEAQLMAVQGGRLIEIIHFDKEVICPVKNDDFIMGGDRLIFAGQIQAILALKKNNRLVNATHPIYKFDELDHDRKLWTASIDFGSQLIGETISESDFEDKNNLMLVAVARKGERIDQSPRDIKLRLGDTLLLEGPKNFQNVDHISSHYNLHLFNFKQNAATTKMTLVSSLIMVGMVLLSSFNLVPLLQSCFIAAFAMIICRCCSVEQAQNSINWKILMIFAGSICLGTAIEKTGLAALIANGLLSICGTNPIVVITSVCLVGTFLTEFISNTAAAAIFYPIAYQAAVTLDVNPLTFCVALMIAISSSFATPIGSPTHMLVYSAGGYRFTDFVKIGLPMNLIILAANIFIVLLLFPL